MNLKYGRRARVSSRRWCYVPRNKSVCLAVACCLLLTPPACKRRDTTPPPPKASAAEVDVCGLLTSAEIQAVQGSPIKETKNNAQSSGGLRISQCFYTAEEFSRSVSLAVTQSDPTSAAKRSVADFWKQTFGRYGGENSARVGDEEKRESLREQKTGRGEEEESIPLKRISGIGDDAYWSSNRMGGALYILKGDNSIRISLGGMDKEEAKIEKSKALAQKALDRL
jgi:hypothetical protein